MDRIKFEPDGRFVIDLSRNRPANASNWLKTERRAETVLVRLTDNAWDQEPKQDWLRIERVCEDCPIAPSPMTQKEVARALNRGAQSLHDRTASWLDISRKIWIAVPRNAIARFRETQNGLKGQYSAFGTFDLKPDEALIVTVPASEAAYQGIQLASRWFVSLDYRTRISSLTRTQAHVDNDGLIRFVLANRDPGVWNWLDTAGHRRGLIMMRWQGLAKKPEVAPTAELVRFDAINAALPDNTKLASDLERRSQIERRVAAIDRRYQ